VVKSKEYEDDMEKKDRRRTESEKVRNGEMNEEQKLQKELSCQAGRTAKQYEDNVYSLKNRAMQQY
jgi:hypothetical protein